MYLAAATSRSSQEKSMHTVDSGKCGMGQLAGWHTSAQSALICTATVITGKIHKFSTTKFYE